VVEVKKVYAGSELAVVILDSPAEIEAVTAALQNVLDHRPDAGLPVLRNLLAELQAPAPQ
jgi:hypothetical protein